MDLHGYTCFTEAQSLTPQGCLGNFDVNYSLHYNRARIPGQPVDFTAPLIVATRPDKPLTAGHRYRFWLNEGQSIIHWYEGTREEVMLSPRQDAPAHKDMQKIILDVRAPIEFEVHESEHSVIR